MNRKEYIMDYETLRVLVNTNYLRVEMDMNDLDNRKEILVNSRHNMDKDTLEEMFRFYKKAIDEANKKMSIMRFETTLIYDPERDIFI